ncbi:MAG: KH domain-containing protein [Eubacteriales bacterium]|nr:KH domain-containing protein [Eubacteriales bacterium]
MRELVELIAKALVDHPDEVVVTQKQEGRNIRIQLHVAPSDMGKVIGKQGRIAKAIRSVVKAAASRDEIRVDVDID